MKLYCYIVLFFLFNILLTYVYYAIFLDSNEITNYNIDVFKINNSLEYKKDMKSQDLSYKAIALPIIKKIADNILLSNNEFEELISHPLPYSEENFGVESGIVKTWNFRYPIYTIIPPLPINKELSSEIVSRSTFYKNEIAENAELCNEPNLKEVCENPSVLASYYYKNDCSSDKCGSKETYILKARNEYKTGRVEYVKNGIIKIKQFDCGFRADYKHFEMKNNDYVYYVPSTVIYLQVPQSFSFQHFCDGLLPKLVQIESLLGRDDVKYFMEFRNYHKIVPYLLRKIGIKGEQILSYTSISRHFQYIKADELIIPCNTPPLHPVLWRRMQYILKVPALTNNNPRKLILYLERGGKLKKRLVVNNDDVKRAIENYFKNTEYEFRVFNSSTFENDFDLFGRAFALIGPHGGAFQNMLYLKSGSIIMEFQLNSYAHLAQPVRFIFHRQAVLLGHKYYTFLCEVVGINLIVDINTLETYLEAVFPK